MPLGVLIQNIWARPGVPAEDYQEMIERLHINAIKEQEKSMQVFAPTKTMARTAAGFAVVTGAERESDLFEFLA